MRGLHFLCAAGFGAMTCTAAQAQTDKSSAQPVTTVEAGSIEEIIVTARRREESLQSVPVAVTALTGVDLENRAITNVADLPASVPNLQVMPNSSGQRAVPLFALRGLRSSAVTLYSAEIVRFPESVTNALYDLENVQVLKGPQGTLFGANSTSGAILFQPARPRDTVEGSIEARVGNYGLIGGTGVLNLPIGAGAAMRLAVDGQHRDGYVKRTGGRSSIDNDNHYSARLSLELQPDDVFLNRTVVEYYHFNYLGAPTVPLGYTPCPAVPNSSAPCVYNAANAAAFNLPTWVDAFNTRIALGDRTTNILRDLTYRGNFWSISNLTEVQVGNLPVLGELNWRTILGFQNNRSSWIDDADGLVLQAADTVFRYHRERKSFESQIQGSAGPSNWVVGVYYERSGIDFIQDVLINAPVSPFNPVITDSDTPTRQLGLYAQATIGLTDTLKATLGYRHTRTRIGIDVQIFAGPFCGIAAGPGSDFTRCVRSQSAVFKEPSWTLGFDWQVDPSTLVYIVSRRGFNAGGFNSGAALPQDASFDPERLTDFELGFKRDWSLGGSAQLRTNIALFLNKYDNVQRSNTVFNTVGGVTRSQVLTLNAAKATLKGVEAEIELAPTTGLKFGLSGSYIDAQYDEFPFTTAAGTTLDLSSNRIALAPEWVFQGSIDYDLPEIGGVGKPSLHFNYAYQSTVYFSDFNQTDNTLPNTADPFNIQKGYGIANGRVGLDDVAGTGISLSFWVRNIFDKRYFASKLNSGPLGFAFGTLGDKRVFGINAGYRF